MLSELWIMVDRTRTLIAGATRQSEWLPTMHRTYYYDNEEFEEQEL
jgi:hypothetical protein